VNPNTLYSFIVHRFRSERIISAVSKAPAVLHEHAQVLKSCGGDILIGDFRIFPKLKNLSEEVLRQRNAEMFKT